MTLTIRRKYTHNLFARIFSSSSSAKSSKYVKRTFWQRLVEPVAVITEPSERRQARLVSVLLLVLMVSMVGGVVFMWYSPLNQISAFVLAGADILIAITYFLSRTRHNKLAAFISLVVLSIIPILNITLGSDHSSEVLLTLLIWNSLTIVLSSAITSARNTTLFVFVNILTPLLLMVFIPNVSFNNMVLPLSFNCVISISILVFSIHRNLLEKDRLFELAQANERLQSEVAVRKSTQEKLSYASLHDSLTDLPNRVLFMDRLKHVMERAKRNMNIKYAVFFMDLDRFKVVNDSLGHNIGDLLLIESAKRLLECVRSEDTVARLGGDEFVVLLEDIKDTSDYIRVADRIKHNLALSADLEDHRVFISVSIGIVLSDARYEQPEDVLRDTDIAMYQAKRLGRGRYEIFDPKMLDNVMTRMELETDLMRALENHEFIVHYQPILEIKSHRIAGFEALVRWQHPTRGLTAPEEFIPVAEDIGLIVPIGYWVMEQACAQIRDWQMQYPSDPPLTMNVNLSTRQFNQPDLVQKIFEILRKNKLDPGSLKLELTESLIMEDFASTTVMLSQLREMGIQVQIDDFGTGYSSLSYLHKLSIDTLKIDRTFISQLAANGNGSEIVQTILSLAHSLGMKVIAEGVETDGQLSSLLSMNCEYMQGFLFSKAVDSQEAGAILEKGISAGKA